MNVESTLKLWLVEIKRTNTTHSRVFDYEEIFAKDEIDAKHLGLEQFINRCKYEPVMKRRVMALNIIPQLCVAGDVVELDD